MGLTSRLLISVALVAPTSAVAQGAIELDEAFVFSGILPVEVNRTGSTVEIVEGDELEDGSVSVEAALDRLPGVSTTSSGGIGTQSSVRIRGMDGRYIGVTVDGIEVTDASSIQTQFSFGQLTKAGIGRIEVAKGAQGTVYGSDAIAGAVNITSWRPEKDGLSWGGSVEAGSFDTRAVTLHYGQRDEDTEVALTLSHTQSDGISARDHNDEADPFKQTLLTLSVEQDLDSGVTLGGSVFAADDLSSYDGFSAGDEVGESDGQRRGARVFARFDTGVVENEVSLSFFSRDRDEVGSGGTSRFESERRKLAYLGTASLSEATTLAFGADWTEEEAVFDGGAGDASNGAIFGEVQHALSSATDISLSLRHDIYSDFDDQTTARLAAVHRLDNGLSLKAALATGYRAPSLYERFHPIYGDATLVPESSIGAEIGVEQALANGWVSATVFQTEIDDLIDFDYVGFTGYVQTPGTQVAKGVEVAFETEVRNVTLFGSYTYTDGRTPPNPFAPSERLRRVPRHDLTLGAEATLAPKLDGSVDLRVFRDANDGNNPVDDYQLVNLGLSYAMSEAVTAYARVENLLDETYQSVPGYNAPGRAFYVGVTADF